MLHFLAETDWTATAGLTGAIIALGGFIITAWRGRKSDDLATMVALNDALERRVEGAEAEAVRANKRATDADLRAVRLEKRVEDLEDTLVKCQRENGTLRRKLAKAV